MWKKNNQRQNSDLWPMTCWNNKLHWTKEYVLKVHFFTCVHTRRGMPLICAWIRWENLNIYSDKELIWQSSVPVLFQYFTSQNASEPIRDSKIWPNLADPLLRNEAKLSTTSPPAINNIHNRRFTNPIPNCVFSGKSFCSNLNFFVWIKTGQNCVWRGKITSACYYYFSKQLFLQSM